MNRVEMNPESNFFCPICSGLSEKSINQLLECAIPTTFEEGKMVYFQDDDYRGLFVISKGSIRLSHENEDGKEVFIKVIGKNQTFGESGMTQLKFLESAQAIEPSSCIFIPKKNLQELMASNAELTLSVFKSVNLWLVEFYNRFKVLSQLSVKKRIQLYLKLESERLNTNELSFGLRRHEIASNLGIRPETLSRVLKELCKEGLVTQNGPSLVIHELN